MRLDEALSNLLRRYSTRTSGPSEKKQVGHGPVKACTSKVASGLYQILNSSRRCRRPASGNMTSNARGLKNCSWSRNHGHQSSPPDRLPLPATVLAMKIGPPRRPMSGRTRPWSTGCQEVPNSSHPVSHRPHPRRACKPKAPQPFRRPPNLDGRGRKIPAGTSRTTTPIFRRSSRTHFVPNKIDSSGRTVDIIIGDGPVGLDGHVTDLR